jgi:hypothetical protein
MLFKKRCKKRNGMHLVLYVCHFDPPFCMAKVEILDDIWEKVMFWTTDKGLDI